MFAGRWALGAALVVSLQAVLIPVAHADSTAEASKSFSAGLAADKRGDFAAAIRYYTRAYELKPHPNAAYNIAVDYEHLGKNRDAAGWYETYANTVNDPEERSTTKQHLDELKHLDAPLSVASQPVGAEVHVDGRVVGTTPYGGMLDTGHHVITIGTEPREVDVLYGEPVDIDVELTPEQFGIVASSTTQVTAPSLVDPHTLAPPPGEPGGGIRILGGPNGAYVFIDNQAVGVIGTWSGSIEVAVGSHDVAIQRPGFEPFRRNVYVTVHEETNVEVPGSLETDEAAKDEKNPRARFVFGVAGGAGIRNDEQHELLLVEAGIRGPKTDIVTRVGVYGGKLAIDGIVRYSIGSTRIRPLLGIGYSYIGKFTLEFVAGVRLDVKKYGSSRVSLVAEAGLRVANLGEKDDFGTLDDAETKTFVPLLMFLEVAR